MKRLLTLLSLIPIASPSLAAEYLQCGWRITGWYNNGCPAGSQDNDSCGCSASAAPNWYGAQLAMQVENQGGNGISASQFQQAAHESAAAWSGVSCSRMVVDASGSIAAASTARWGNYNNDDSEHGIFFVSDENEWARITGSGAGGTLGVTVSPWSSYGCNDRSFYDTDILINGFVYGGWSYSSLKSVVMHEMGHSLGLGHPCLMGLITGQCSGECQALMGATGGEYSTPQQDDINGICGLYPGTPGGLGATCSGNGDCSSAPVCVDYQDFKYCSHTCGTCEDGYTCKNVGGQDVCVRQGAPAAGDVCTGPCESGAVCVQDGDNNTAHCYVSCTPPDGSCPGQDRCVELQGGSGICWPPGSQAVGELCGSQQTGDCAPGGVCLRDDANDNTVAHCYRECDRTQPTSCGSGWLCETVGTAPDEIGICLRAAGPNQPCEPPAADYTCENGWTCTPPPGGGNTYVCNRECTINQSDSCGAGEICQTFVDNNQNPVVAACYPAGDKQEGESCGTPADCVDNMLCVTVSQGSAICLVGCDPASANCPHSGQSCEALQGGGGICYPAGGSAGVDGGGGSSGRDAGVGPGRDAGVTNPNGKGYMEPCSDGSECMWGVCTGVSGYGSICLKPCDPRIGHYDCPTNDNSGCVPNDTSALNFGGQCQPGVTAAASLAVGQACDSATGYQQCTSGLCEQDLCLMACNKGLCPSNYQCDTSELADPGVCRPLAQGPVCGCAASGRDAATLLPLIALLGLIRLRLRRRRG